MLSSAARIQHQEEESNSAPDLANLPRWVKNQTAHQVRVQKKRLVWFFA
jgi:hypothetical protein